jgi:hypothetical protein
VATRLARGLSPVAVGPRRDGLRLLPLPVPEALPNGALCCHVIYVDHFGNLVTDARAEDLPAGPLVVEVAGQRIAGLSRSYVDGPNLLALIDSWGRLEVAARDGNAAGISGLGAGDPVLGHVVGVHRRGAHRLHALEGRGLADLLLLFLAGCTPNGMNAIQQTALVADGPGTWGTLQTPLAVFTNLKGYIESDFGFRRANGTKYHFGLDIAVPKQTPVSAAAAGQVLFVGCDVTTRSVVLWHEALGLSTMYMHLLSTPLAPGQAVAAGQQIGLSGPESGYGPHLDFRVYKGKWQGGCPADPVQIGPAANYVDPLRYLPRSLDTGAPTVAAIQVSPDKLSGFGKPRLGKDGALALGNQPLWLRIRVSAADKDVDGVRVLLRAPDGQETELHRFDYYAGDAAVNPAMPLEDDPGSDGFYASVVTNVEHGKPSDDLFAWRLTPDLVPADGKTYTVIFRVGDAYNHQVDVALPMHR